MKKLLMAGCLGVLAIITVIGCQADKSIVALPETGYTVEQVIDAIDAKSPTRADSVYLASVPADLWDEVERRIGETGLMSSDNSASSAKVMGWPWDGSTRADIALCEQNGYGFQGHHAVYFVVDGPANCYNKDLDWWVTQCVITHGCVSGWDLRLSGDWYWRDGKWVKNVALIVPTIWWYNYWWWPNDFKARRFLLYWNDVANGYCE